MNASGCSHSLEELGLVALTALIIHQNMPYTNCRITLSAQSPSFTCLLLAVKNIEILIAGICWPRPAAILVSCAFILCLVHPTYNLKISCNPARLRNHALLSYKLWAECNQQNQTQYTTSQNKSKKRAP